MKDHPDAFQPLWVCFGLVAVQFGVECFGRFAPIIFVGDAEGQERCFVAVRCRLVFVELGGMVLLGLVANGRSHALEQRLVVAFRRLVKHADEPLAGPQRALRSWALQLEVGRAVRMDQAKARQAQHVAAVTTGTAVLRLLDPSV